MIMRFVPYIGQQLPQRCCSSQIAVILATISASSVFTGGALPWRSFRPIWRSGATVQLPRGDMVAI